MQPFISDLQSSLKDVGLIVNEKSASCSIHQIVQSFGSVPVVSHGTEILRIFIGCHQFVQTRCSKITNSGHALCSELVKLRCPQSATLLLRFCHVTQMNYLARCVSPYSFEYAANYMMP